MLDPEYTEVINIFAPAIKTGLTTRQLKSMPAYSTVGSDFGSML
ncbi:hypothetical protein [Euzebya sp.]